MYNKAISAAPILAALGAILVTQLVSHGREESGAHTGWVALTALVANPSRFDGQELTTFGYYLVGVEQSALCPQPRMAWTSDCIFLTRKASAAKIDKLTGRPVMVKGVFRYGDNTPGEFYSGWLTVTKASAVPEVRNSDDR
ncbi:MAG: hypothetical protein IPG63_15185 [Xanthomonadales bacterium]|nr:hypothetical protein [Xanthomonadales bacterium]MBK7146865.1 hypothetical protein [Xanthomonadales bacterium]